MKVLGLWHRIISWVWVRGGIRSVSEASLELGADGLGDQRKGCADELGGLRALGFRVRLFVLLA